MGGVLQRRLSRDRRRWGGLEAPHGRSVEAREDYAASAAASWRKTGASSPGPEALQRSFVVVATSDQPALQRIKAALTATSIAEHFRDQGANVMLQGERVVLRAPVPADAEAWRAAGRHPEVTRGYGEHLDAWQPFPADGPAEMAADLIARRGWMIEAGGEVVGHISLDDEGFVGLGLLRDDLLGRGLGTDALRTVLGWAAGPPLSLARVHLRVGEHNARGIASYGRCGFSLTGHEEDAFVLDGRPHADLVMTAELR